MPTVTLNHRTLDGHNPPRHLCARCPSGHRSRRSPFASDSIRPFSLAFLGTRAQHYVFARNTCEYVTIEIEQKGAAGHVWARLIVMDLAHSIDPRSMYSSTSRPDFLLSFSDTVFQGKSPDEHAARIQVSAGERRDAVHRRQPPFRHTLAQEHSLLFSVQGDESFLMESLSIHLLSLIIVDDSRRR